MTIGVYVIKAPNSWNCYVGSSENCEERRKRHQGGLCKGLHHSVLLQRAYDKYGDKLEWYIIWTMTPRQYEANPSKLREVEEDYMDDLPGKRYNATDSTYAIASDPRVRRKISQTLLEGYASGRIKTSGGGQFMSAKGKRRQALAMGRLEVWKKLSKAHKGEVWSDERRAKHKAAFQRPEVKARLSAIRSGRVWTPRALHNLRRAMKRPEVREKISVNTRAAMCAPAIRKKIRDGIRRARLKRTA